eukprot:CAMPEP_0181312244 /NCGR_PEP_ID=MMETSP1101-20121128/13591_1 /TAXON_ID=46948 /ORGANISM="Rhodomonas abbreviata, Strain Caron Lab Isolate" /LENGTH=210 /DNA_ID=CAMNT_0023419077 /DNA_START=79 /DNA_END=711 /DNA_ORIENTATION=-
MNRLFFFLLVALTSVAAYTAEEKAASIKIVTDMGFPDLAAWHYPPFSAKVLKSWIEREATVITAAFDYVKPAEMEAIFATVSASNGCEICLSFHSMMMGSHKVEAEEIKAIVAGGNPSDKRLQGVVAATKIALMHKGIILPREKEHLKIAYGIEMEEFFEILYITSHIESNNRMFVHMLAENIELEDMLKTLGPFSDTVYKEYLAKKNEL